MNVLLGHIFKLELKYLFINDYLYVFLILYNQLCHQSLHTLLLNNYISLVSCRLHLLFLNLLGLYFKVIIKAKHDI